MSGVRTDPHHRAHGSTRCPRASADGHADRRRPIFTHRLNYLAAAALPFRNAASSSLQPRPSTRQRRSTCQLHHDLDIRADRCQPTATALYRAGPRWAERQEPKTPALDASDLHDAWHGPLDEAWKGLREALSGYRDRRGPPDWPQEEERSSATTPSVKRRPRRPARGRGPSVWQRRSAEGAWLDAENR